MNEQTSTTAEVIPYIFYRDVPAALEWLGRTFGFVETMRHTTPSGGMHAQMTVHGRTIMLGTSAQSYNMRTPAETGTPTQGVFIYIHDVAAQHRRTVAEGAKVDGAPTDHGYGLTYTAHDLDGHPWFFTQRPAS